MTCTHSPAQLPAESEACGSASAWEPCADRQGGGGEGRGGWMGWEGEGSCSAAAAAAALLPEPSRLTKMALNKAVLATSHPTWLELDDVAQRQSA
jgi:hypothetical protein